MPTKGSAAREEELLQFANDAHKGQCGTARDLSGKDAAAGAADLFAQFGGVEGYAKYLSNDIKIPGAEVPLNGGAQWQRVLAEVEVAMRLAHPPAEELANLAMSAVRAGGTGVHGHQRWEDVASKLMISIAFEPLLRRVRYVAARVAWVLRHQKVAVSEWMSVLSEGPASRIYSPLFVQHLSVLRSSPIIQDLVFGAYDDAVSVVGEQVLKNLSGTLTAACINPEIMLRPRTETDLDAKKLASSPPVSSGSSGADKKQKAAEARKRVTEEMKRRSGPSGGVPKSLQERVFDPKEVKGSVNLVQHRLQRAFSVLADILANQAFAFADASMSVLCRRQVDEAMSSIEFSNEQRRILYDNHRQHVEVARQVEDRLSAVRRCLSSLRTNAPAPHRM